MKIVTLILLALSAHLSIAQSVLADSIVSLAPPLEESSGLAILGSRIITIGDSGNPPALYEIDTVTGSASRTVYISNASNVDWEALTSDTSYIYIGDFGNNNGNRMDLKIYKVSISAYLNAANDSVMADVIQFEYADQTDFTPAPLQTNFDAEALVNYRDSLYIFTKQWGKGGTSIYSVPKSPGTYALTKVDSLQTTGLVTGGCYNLYFGTLVLITNTPFVPYAQIASGWQPGNWTNSLTSRQLVVKESIQVEAVDVARFRKYFITSEKSVFGEGLLSKAEIQPIGLDENRMVDIKLYPNPTTGLFKIDSPIQIESIRVYDGLGKLILIKTGKDQNRIELENAGTYIVEIQLEDGTVVDRMVSVTQTF